MTLSGPHRLGAASTGRSLRDAALLTDGLAATHRPSSEQTRRRRRKGHPDDDHHHPPVLPPGARPLPRPAAPSQPPLEGDVPFRLRHPPAPRAGSARRRQAPRGGGGGGGARAHARGGRSVVE